MNKVKLAVVCFLVLLILGGGAGVVWWLNVPHTVEEQFKLAERLEKHARADQATGKPMAELEPETVKAIKQYERVEANYGKSDKAAEAWARIARLHEELLKSNTDAITTLQRIAKDYPTETFGGEALINEARLIREEAELLKTGKPSDAIAKYKEALAVLEEYRKKFPTGAKADLALIEIGRIWQDGIGDPKIKAIETFQAFLKEFPLGKSDYRSEAMFRLAQLLEFAKEYDKALNLYGQLLEEDPKGPWSDKALFYRGKLLADKMDKPKEGEKDMEQLLQDHADSPLAGQAGGEAKAMGEKAAQGDSEKYRNSRYGGHAPVDTLMDKAIPSQTALFKMLLAQKLNAEKYTLDVTFDPPAHHIAVNGTLALTNKGGEKKELYFMLAPGMKVTATSVNGVKSQQTTEGETWHIVLPTPLAKDAPAVLAFTYDGEFAAPIPGTEDFKKEIESSAEGSKPGTAPATERATAPASAPASAPAKPKELPKTYNPQLALGDFGYALSGSAWYPVTVVGDLLNADITYHAPVGTEVVGSGGLISRTPENGTYHFATSRPIFGIYFAYGNYIVQEAKVHGTQYYTYFRRENASKHQAYVDVASSILDFYGSKYTPFPYEKLAIVEVPLPPFLGGVGPASLMMLHEGMVVQKKPPSTLLAHELAHQWWGNLVPINMTDPGYNQWLSEGFATYSDALYTEKMDGPEAMSKHMQRYGQLYFQFAAQFGSHMQSLKDVVPSPRSPLYRPVTYERGALVLHTLRKIMGDDKFFALMRKFVETYHDQLITVDDFRHMASDVAGQDLSLFFSQWYDHTVYARWKFTDVKITDLAGSSSKVVMSIIQPDDLLALPVDITFHGEKGEVYVMPNVNITGKDQIIEATVPFKPIKIVLDEANWILKHPAPDNIWPAAPKVPVAP